MATIKATILDSDGKPLSHIAEISEFIPGMETTFPTVAVNKWSDPANGKFTFTPLNDNSYILISAHGYNEVMFPANAVPDVIQLEDAIVINGKVKKKNNSLWLYLAGAAVLTGAVLYAVNKNTEKPPKSGKTPNKTAPKQKTLPPRKVTI